MGKRKERKGYVADEQIVELYWQRDEKAIQETDRKYGAFLYRIAYQILYDPQDCEECRNDTYLGIWNAIPPTKPAVFQAFITQIMRRIAINRYKEKTRQKRVPSELAVSMEDLYATLHSGESVEDVCDAAEVGEMISSFVKDLPERQQYVFVARFYMAEPVERIASDLSVGKSSVYREIDALKKSLKHYLEEKGVYV